MSLIGNPALSINVEEQSCEISSEFNLKSQNLGLFEEGHPKKMKKNNNNSNKMSSDMGSVRDPIILVGSEHIAFTVQVTIIQMQLTNNHEHNNCSSCLDPFCNVWNWEYVDEWIMHEMFRPIECSGKKFLSYLEISGKIRVNLLKFTPEKLQLTALYPDF